MPSIHLSHFPAGESDRRHFGAGEDVVADDVGADAVRVGLVPLALSAVLKTFVEVARRVVAVGPLFTTRDRKAGLVTTRILVGQTATEHETGEHQRPSSHPVQHD